MNTQPSHPISNDTELEMTLNTIKRLLDKPYLEYDEENYLCFLEILVDDYEQHKYRNCENYEFPTIGLYMY